MEAMNQLLKVCFYISNKENLRFGLHNFDQLN